MDEREYTIKKTLGRLKNDVKNDIDINSARIYQSIRTLSEYVLKITLESLDDKFLVENKNITMHDMFYHLNDNYSFNFDTGKYYKEIIRQRNLKEHSPEKFNPEIDHKKIKEIVFFYNDLSKALCEISSCKDNLFRINEDVFYDKPPVVIDETHTSGEMNSRETKAIFEKRRLEKKLDDMEKVEGNSTEKNRRKIRSERLTIENHIKMNDGKLMSIYMFKNKNKRKPISLKKEAMRFFIGLSEKDYGFAVEGLEASGRCDHPYAHIYSVIYNLLLRNKIYRPTSFLKQNERNQGIKINYANVVKYQIMFLLLVKNNYCNQDILSFKLENGNQNEFLIAIKDILNYASTVARLSASDFTAPPIKISEDGIGISIGTHPDASAYCTDLLECDRNCKSTSWIEPGLQFSINAGNKIDMEFILENAFGFKTFKKGQFETICNILNSDASSICIMPTASGKSLIYYFYSIMTSMPTIIVSPTKLLIEDQIRNLNQIHGYYSCTGLDENLDYSDYSFEHMLNFATPEIFMNQTFTDRVSQIISSGKIKTIVLDEIHCASNWSHDYRPAYLMLSKYISASMPNVRILGFTATTSYLITKDIMRQYSISKENIYEPISLTREDIHLSFHGYPDVNEIIEGLESSFIQNNFARSIVFTKNSDMTKVVYQKLKPSIQIKCDCFTDSSLDSYYDFVNGNIDIMIANNQMGIGVNMPDIVNSYHIGFPLSKNHFIQEAGRIARNGLHGEASIIFNSLSNLGYTEKKLLDISTPVEELVEVINMSNTNYSDILNSFKNIMGHVEDPHSCIKNLKSIYGSFPSEEKHIGLFVYNDEESRYAMDRKNIHAQTYLLTLKNMGIIKEWYIHSTNSKGTFYSIVLDEDSHKLAHVKYSLTTYLRNLDGDNATIQKVKQCKNMDEIFSVYSNWYYYSFLYHHREQFSNIVHMVSENSKYPMMHSASEPFHFEPDSLASYFSLSIETTENVKENILSKPITDLINNYGSISKTHLQPFVEHCIEDNYNVLFDIVLLCMAAVKNRGSIVERFNRIINKMDTEQLKEFHDKLPKFYSYCKGENRIVMLNYIHNHTKINIETLYSEIERDLAYYSLYCKTINQKLTGGIQDARY